MYDQWGLAYQETAEFPGGPSRTSKRVWTPTDQASQVAVNFADVVQRNVEYDGAGRLAKVAFGAPDVLATSPELRLVWAGKRLAGREYRNLPQDTAPVWADTWQFDPFQRPRGVSGIASSSGKLFELATASDANSRVSSVATLLNGQGVGDWRGYSYDGSGRLADVLEAAHVAPPSVDGTPITDVFGAGAAFGAKTWQYARDPLIGSTTEIAAPAESLTRLRAPLPRAPGHQLSSVALNGGPSVTVSHDAYGRVKTVGDRQFEYDLLGRLAVVRTALGEVLEQYLYGGRGELRGVLGPDGTQRFTLLYDNGRPAVAFDGAGKPAWEATWTPDGGHLLAWRDFSGAGRSLLAIEDLRHGIVSAWDTASANLAGVVRLDPEGRLASESTAGNCAEINVGDICPGVGNMPFAFSSAWRSPTTGLVWLGARWYSPVLGEFLTPDPIGVVDSWNRYAYARFDPINQWDPTGLEAVELAKKCEEAGLDIGSICVYNALTENGRVTLRQLPKNRIDFWDTYLRTGGDRLRDIVLTNLAMSVAAEGLAVAAQAAFRLGRFGFVMLRGTKGTGGAAKLLPGGTGRAFAGHGIETGFAGTTVVPEGTTLMLPGRAGTTIPDSLGRAIEAGDWAAIAANPKWTAIMEGSTTYLSGAEIPNLLLRPATALTTLENSIRVVKDTTLSELLEPGLGNLCWAACREIIP